MLLQFDGEDGEEEDDELIELYGLRGSWSFHWELVLHDYEYSTGVDWNIAKDRLWTGAKMLQDADVFKQVSICKDDSIIKASYYTDFEDKKSGLAILEKYGLIGREISFYRNNQHLYKLKINKFPATLSFIDNIKCESSINTFSVMDNEILIVEYDKVLIFPNDYIKVDGEISCISFFEDCLVVAFNNSSNSCIKCFKAKMEIKSFQFSNPDIVIDKFQTYKNKLLCLDKNGSMFCFNEFLSMENHFALVDAFAVYNGALFFSKNQLIYNERNQSIANAYYKVFEFYLYNNYIVTIDERIHLKYISMESGTIVNGRDFKLPPLVVGSGEFMYETGKALFKNNLLFVTYFETGKVYIISLESIETLNIIDLNKNLTECAIIENKFITSDDLGNISSYSIQPTELKHEYF